MTDDLKPCPFCGENALLEEDNTRRGAFYIGCHTAGCMGNYMWGETKEEAKRGWNTRAD